MSCIRFVACSASHNKILSTADHIAHLPLSSGHRDIVLSSYLRHIQRLSSQAHQPALHHLTLSYGIYPPHRP